MNYFSDDNILPNWENDFIYKYLIYVQNDRSYLPQRWAYLIDYR